jgi:hypothetical protein
VKTASLLPFSSIQGVVRRTQRKLTSSHFNIWLTNSIAVCNMMKMLHEILLGTSLYLFSVDVPTMPPGWHNPWYSQNNSCSGAESCNDVQSWTTSIPSSRRRQSQSCTHQVSRQWRQRPTTTSPTNEILRKARDHLIML